MSPLTELCLATGSFVGTHLIMSHPLRKSLVGALGDRGFLGLYSLVSFATLGWMILAARAASGLPPHWIAPPFIWQISNIVMLLAAVLLAGSLKGNPAMVDPGGRPAIPQKASGVFAITRHPMMWSFALWALVHAGLWGSAPNVVIAGGIGTLAIVGALGQDSKKLRLIGPPWKDWESRTSFMPFLALFAGRAGWRAAWPGWFAITGGALLWSAATWLHPYFGGPQVGLWTGLG